MGDIGDDSSELVAAGGGCDRAALLAAVSGARKTVLERGFDWFDQKVPYSQSASHKGFRTDCSGFVSMCWQLNTSFTTADFISGGGQNEMLSSYDQLVPGDAIVRRSGGQGHVVLFAGWKDNAHTGACVLEQASTALDMQFRVRTTASLKQSGFKPIRADKLAGASQPPITAPGPKPTTPDAPVSDPKPDPKPDTKDEPTGSAGGESCASDGACNPGNDGSGLICVAGKCVPGCHSNAHCPGTTVCSAGKCK